MYRDKITTDVVSITCAQESIGAMFVTTVKLGNVFHVEMNGQTLVTYTIFTLRDNNLAINITGNFNLSGVENLYTASFERLMRGKEVLAAAKLVASSFRWGGLSQT